MALSDASACSRRRLLGWGAAAAGIAVTGGLPIPSVHAAPRPQATQPSPDEALQRLIEGNARFVAGTLQNPNQTLARVQQVAPAQLPFAAIVGCADSRVPPEIVFDQGVGDLFVVRVAGNIVTEEGAASLEYAVATFGTPLILVLGHTRCGAVDAAIKSVQTGSVLPGSLPSLVRALQPAVEASAGQPGDPVDNAARANIARTVAELRTYDTYLAERIQRGQLKIAGGYYDLDSGRVQIIA